MEKRYREELTHLHGKLTFEVEPISATDLFYTDGLAQGSLFKLLFQTKGDNGHLYLRSIVYIYPQRWWVSYGSITDAESLAIHDWIDQRVSEGSR